MQVYVEQVYIGFFYSITQFVIFAIYAILFYVGGNLYKKDKATFTNILRAIFTILFSALGVGIAQMFVGDYSAVLNLFIGVNLFSVITSNIQYLYAKIYGFNKDTVFS